MGTKKLKETNKERKKGKKQTSFAECEGRRRKRECSKESGMWV